MCSSFKDLAEKRGKTLLICGRDKLASLWAFCWPHHIPLCNQGCKALISSMLFAALGPSDTSNCFHQCISYDSGTCKQLETRVFLLVNMNVYCSELDDSTFTVISDECLKNMFLNLVTELQYSFVIGVAFSKLLQHEVLKE